MRLKSLLGTGIVALGILGGLGFAETASAYSGNEYWEYVNEQVAGQYIQIPSLDLRYVVSGHNRHASVTNSDLFKNYGLITPESALEYEGLFSEEVWYIESLEGLDHFTNINHFGIDGLQGVTDFRPLSKLVNLEYLNLTYARVSSLNFVKDMKQLRSLDIETDGNEITSGYVQSLEEAEETYKYGLPEKVILQDLSPLSDLSSLEYIYIEMLNGEFEPISMKNGYRKYEVFEPITLSTQFGDTTLTYSSTDTGFSNTDGVLKWNAVPYGTKELNLSWSAETEGGSYRYNGSATIPIIWK